VRLRFPRRVRRHAAQQEAWEPGMAEWLATIFQEIHDFGRRKG
jgi:hypothetical protein